MLLQPELNDFGIKIVNQNNFINILKPVSIKAEYKTDCEKRLIGGKLSHIR